MPLTIRGNIHATLQPPIPKIQSWATSYRPSESQPLLNLSQGVPGEAPDPLVTERLSRVCKEMDKEAAGYGPISGEKLLQEAVQEEMKGIYRWDQTASSSQTYGVSANQISITSGCNQAWYMVMSVLCSAGDEVILPCPWVGPRISMRMSAFTLTL